MEISDSLIENFKNKVEIKNAIQGLQLSRNTVMRRIESMNQNRSDQYCEDVAQCVAFSLQMDESTDVTDAAQLLVLSEWFSRIL